MPGSAASSASRRGSPIFPVGYPEDSVVPSHGMLHPIFGNGSGPYAAATSEEQNSMPYAVRTQKKPCNVREISPSSMVVWPIKIGDGFKFGSCILGMDVMNDTLLTAVCRRKGGFDVTGR